MFALTITLTTLSILSIVLITRRVDSATVAKTLPPTCDSPIYCQGRLLDTVQMAQIFPDSKTFVDKRMLHPQDVVLANFDQFMNRTGQKPTKDQILSFVDANFADGDELEPADLPDWQPSPTILKKIKDPAYQRWASNLNDLWNTLGRKMKDSVKANISQYSILEIPNSFVVPGGRFREIYYWDTYWIVQGLLACDMPHTVKNILGNFVFQIKTHGIIPNGGRVYYLERSQPPLLTAMVARYVEYSKDKTWLRENIDHLSNELEFWLKNRVVQVRGHDMFHYYAPSLGARPESYIEDVLMAQGDQDLYTELKSGAESGWDFSYRWVIDQNTSQQTSEKGRNLRNLKASKVVPVDLNAILCGAFDNLSHLYSLLDDQTSAQKWQKHHDRLAAAVKSVMWDEKRGAWFDYNLLDEKLNYNFYPSNVAMLWTRCLAKDQDINEVGDRVVEYLDDSGGLNYQGGIPASLNNTGEQWDFPNAWPPLQAIVIDGLNNGGKNAQTLAKKLAYSWMSSNFIGWLPHQYMYEKYDAQRVGQYGGGGEYEVQAGFGWTNGIDLYLLDLYPDADSSSEK